MIQKSYMLLGTGYSHWTHHFSDVGPKKCSLLNCVYKTLIRCFQTWAISSPVFSACSQIFQICRWLVTIIYIYIWSPCFLHVKKSYYWVLTKIHRWMWYQVFKHCLLGITEVSPPGPLASWMPASLTQRSARRSWMPSTLDAQWWCSKMDITDITVLVCWLVRVCPVYDDVIWCYLLVVGVAVVLGWQCFVCVCWVDSMSTSIYHIFICVLEQHLVLVCFLSSYTDTGDGISHSNTVLVQSHSVSV